MLLQKLKEYKIILASASPRRKQFFKEMGMDCTIRPIQLDEVYPDTLRASQISDYLAKLKADAYTQPLEKKEILVTSDTVVWHNNESLAKPADENEAFSMLQTLSNDQHEVITSVCFTASGKQKIVHHSTKVTFKNLSDDEIWYYIKNYNPYDKAGGYGIQDWIGLIGITEIQGSYTNVVGLPTQLVYKTLMDMVD